jgi:hypothetical protein
MTEHTLDTIAGYWKALSRSDRFKALFSIADMTHLTALDLCRHSDLNTVRRSLGESRVQILHELLTQE